MRNKKWAKGEVMKGRIKSERQRGRSMANGNGRTVSLSVVGGGSVMLSVVPAAVKIGSGWHVSCFVTTRCVPAP